MNKQEIISAIVEKAKEWRACDEEEPIGSEVPNEKLKELAFLVDDLNSLEKNELINKLTTPISITEVINEANFLMSKKDLSPYENERLYELGNLIFSSSDNLVKLRKLINDFY